MLEAARVVVLAIHIFLSTGYVQILNGDILPIQCYTIPLFLNKYESLDNVGCLITVSANALRDASISLNTLNLKGDNRGYKLDLSKSAQFMCNSANFLHLAATEIKNENWESAAIGGFAPAAKCFSDSSQSFSFCSNELMGISKHLKETSDVTGCIVMAAAASPDLYQAGQYLIQMESRILDFINIVKLEYDSTIRIYDENYHSGDNRAGMHKISVVIEHLILSAENIRFAGLELQNFSKLLEGY